MLHLAFHLALSLLFLQPPALADHPAPTQSDSTQPFNNFHLYLSPDDDDTHTSLFSPVSKTTVFTNGNVQPPWSPTAHPSSVPPFHHGPYTDRITFEFSHPSYLTYDLQPPLPKSSNSTIATPKTLDFHFDHPEPTGSFSIAYDCHRLSRPHNVTISVVFPILPALSIYFSFTKTCASGPHPHINFGYYHPSPHAPSHPLPIPLHPTPAQPPTFGPHIIDTRLYLKLQPPATSQEFFHINATTSSPALSAHVRGPVFGGVIRLSQSPVIHILYHCHSTGLFQLHLQIPIWPFDPLTATWKKDCGGGRPSGLNVGSTSLNHHDVVNQAETTHQWKMALLMTSDQIGDRAPVVNASTRVKDFWLRNKGAAVHVAPPVVTVEKQDVATAVASVAEGAEGAFDADRGGVVATGGAVRIRVRMVCKRWGRTVVVVTFPVRAFVNVEFGFVKQCRAPRRYGRLGSLKTAKSVTRFTSLVLAAGLAYWWVVQVRRIGMGSKTQLRMQGEYARAPVA